MKLGAKTTALIAAILFAALLAASLVLLHYEGEALKRTIFEGLDGQAKMASYGIGSFIDDGLRASNAIAATLPRDALVKGRRGEIEPYLKRMSEVFPTFQNGIFILDKEGRLLVDYPSHPELFGESFAFRDYYKRTLQEQQGTIGGPYKSVRSGTPVLTFTAPMRDAIGRIIAIVGCSVDLRSRDALGGYRQQKFGKTGYLYVIDKSRQLVLHPENERELTTLEAGTNRVVEAALEGFEGTGETVNSVGVPMLLAVRRIPHTDWIVAVQVPQAEAYAPIAQSRARIIFILGVTMLGAILMGGVATRRVSRPLQQLEQVASRISADLEDAETKGTYSPSPSALEGLKHIRSHDEVGLLAQAFVHLGTRLNLTLASLQHSTAALRQSEERYRRMVEAAQEGIWTIDDAEKATYINKRMAGMLGYEVEELLGRRLHDFTDADGRTELDYRIARRRQGISEHYELRLQRKDGRSLWVLLSASPFLNEQGVFFGSVTLMTDIGARRVAEQQLRLQASALESAANSIIITDRDGAIQWVNPAFTRATGYTSEEAIGETPRILKSGVHDASFYESLWKTILVGKVWQGETTNRRKDGSLYVEETTITPVRSTDGEISNFIVIKVDVTERKRADRALREAEEQYRTIFEENSIGICKRATDGHFASVNPAYARMFGYESPEEMLASVSNAKLLYVDSGRRREIDRQLREQGEVENFEFEAYRKNSSKMWLRASLRTVYSAAGSVLYYVGTAEDITEHKLLEEQLRQAQKMEAIGSLAGGVAHDFNNLLMVISSYGELLMEQVGNNPKLVKMTEQILKAQERGASLTQQLLAFSRRQVLRPTVLDLNSILDDVTKMLHRLIREDIELVITPGSKLGPVNVDAGQMQQVLLNLAVNARDAMPNGGKLTIATANVELDENYSQSHRPTKPGSYIMLAVSDTGVGMDKATQAHVFDPFFTTKAVGKGTGLGLSIVYGVVKQSGGYIWVYSEPGQGTTFKLYLPRVEEAAQVLPKEADSRTSQCGSETILLAEDEDHLREAIREFLVAKGYVLLTARTPAEAIELSQRHAEPIQLLLTDLVMPGMSGTKLAECLRPKYANLQVLYMSGYTDDAVVRNGGMDANAAFLQKPFGLKTLEGKLRELLERRTLDVKKATAQSGG